MRYRLATSGLLVVVAASFVSVGQEPPLTSTKRGVVDLSYVLKNYARKQELLASLAAVSTRTDQKAIRHRKLVRQVFLADLKRATDIYGLRYNYQAICAARVTEDGGEIGRLLASEEADGLYYYSVDSDISGRVVEVMNNNRILGESRAKRPVPATPPLPR